MQNVSESMKGWMERYKRNSVKAATYDRLVTSYCQLNKYPIADICMEELTADDIQRYINQLVDAGYAMSTIKKQYNLLSAFLKYANLEGLIEKPIYQEVRLPARNVVRKESKIVEAYTKAEQRALQTELMKEQKSAYVAVLLMLETGLRVGETLALAWEDVIWERKAIRVNKTMVRIANKRKQFIQDGAKSHASNRVVPLSQTALRLLNSYFDASPNPQGTIFLNEHGDHLSYEVVRYQIQKACLTAGVPYKGLHVFRHTFATNCYYRGANVKLLSKLLGHADVSITYNTYIHLFGDALEEMRNVVD